MHEDERRQILTMLHEGGEALRVSVADLDEQTARQKPAPDRWSVLECVEHVAITEEALYGLVQQATPAGEPLHNPGREAKLLQLALDRKRTIPAPASVWPDGRARGVDKAMRRFDVARGLTVRWVEEFAGDPRAHLTTHPLIKGPVNCYEMMLMIALHPKRHAEQIREIRSTLAAAVR